MSEKNISLESLKQNATTNENDNEINVVDEGDGIPTVTSGIDPRSGMVDPLQAAIQREEEKKKAAQEAFEAAERDRKDDGREYELEVAGGINIGDSLVRRMKLANENVRAIQEQIANEDLDNEIDEMDFDDDDIEEDVVDDEVLNDPLFNDDDIEEDVEDDEDDEYIIQNTSPVKNKKEDKKVSKEVKEEVMEEEVLSETLSETVEVEDSVDAGEEVTIIDESDNEEAEEEVVEETKAPVTEKIANDDLPSQSDMDIDDEDLLDLGDLDDIGDDEDESSDDLSEEEMNNLRDQIKTKLGGNKPVEGMTVVKKAVSLSAALNRVSQEMNTVDWPLMSAGKNVTMKAFSGTEIDALNRGASGRNRFNTMKEIYRNIYDHIMSEKPEFEQWLKITSFMDIEHLYMAIYKASFDKANYIPYNCTDDKCGHIWLSDDIDIIDMCKFKNDAAKKRFMSIYENDTVASQVEAKLYPTTIVPITDTIAIGFREPSIYNTIFENSVLDQKFVDKYTSLLTMMVYIDEIYLIDGNNYVPIRYKKDKQSVAKTTKYRIATYAKIIKALPSDGYNKIVGVIGQINDLGDEVQYCLPEITCPKCGKTVEESITQANQLLFSRHQLNLLSQQ